jgi:hypothetical protein
VLVVLIRFHRLPQWTLTLLLNQRIRYRWNSDVLPGFSAKPCEV